MRTVNTDDEEGVVIACRRGMDPMELKEIISDRETRGVCDSQLSAAV